LDPQKPHFFEAASNQLPSSTVRLSVGLPRCFTSLPCFLKKTRSHSNPRSRDSVAMPPTIRAIGSAPGTSMKHRNSRGGVYVASHLRRLAPRTRTIHFPTPCFLSSKTICQPLLVLSPKSEHSPIIIAYKPFWRFTLPVVCVLTNHNQPVVCALTNHTNALVGVIAQKRTIHHHYPTKTLLAIHQQAWWMVYYFIGNTKNHDITISPIFLVGEWNYN
jgi:hypothetical protein